MIGDVRGSSVTGYISTTLIQIVPIHDSDNLEQLALTAWRCELPVKPT